jgi:hypothetical protein
MIIKAQNKAINFYNLIIFYFNNYFKRKVWEILFVYTNFFSIIFFYFLYFYSKNEAVEFLLIYNFISIFTLSLSANARNISILRDDPIYAQDVIKFRLYISLAILFFIYFLQFFFFIKDIIFFFSINLLTLTFWVIEPLITFYEIRKINFKLSTSLILSHLFIYLNFFFIFYYYRQKEVLSLFFFTISFVNIFYLLFFFVKKKIINIRNSIRKNKLNFQMLNLTFFSSFSIILSVFLIRYFLYLKLDKNLAADVIFCLSIISFPGSLITGFYGARYLGKDVILPSIFKYIFTFFLILFLIAAVILTMNLYPHYNQFLKLFCLSLLGSVIFFFAQAFRILHMGAINLETVFFKDIFFHIFLFFFAYLSISYYDISLLLLIYPIIALVIYCSALKLNDPNKNKK